MEQRSDLQAAIISEQSAEQLKRAAAGQRYPSIAANANYGLIGQSPTNSHGTYAASIALELPIFDGGRIRSDIERADAVLQQRHAESSNLRGLIEYEVRTAFLDLTSARERVDLARSTQNLAQQQLIQARDRFQSGVSDNLEVIQAQTAVIQANETVVASLFAYNVAKALLARAIGSIQQRIFEFLGVNP
jgi:outer membrane protein TolC